MGAIIAIWLLISVGSKWFSSWFFSDRGFDDDDDEE